MSRHRRSLRGRNWISAGAAIAVVLVLALGYGLTRRPAAHAANDVAAHPTASTSSAAMASGTPSPSATASPTQSAAPKASPKHTTTHTPPKKPPSVPLPPAPRPTPSQSAPPGCPQLTGPPASHDEVKAALTSAAQTQWWQRTSRLPPELNGQLPEITVPLPLIKAAAWQESGWQSTIVACDGGVGTMQVMPDTATFMNNRFSTSFSISTLSGNANLGAEYLEWLILYFGLYYFGDYDLSTVAPVGAGQTDMTLLDAVVSAYNVGPGTLENPDGTLSIFNQGYVNNVEALMTTCECLAF